MSLGGLFDWRTSPHILKETRLIRFNNFLFKLVFFVFIFVYPFYLCNQLLLIQWTRKNLNIRKCERFRNVNKFIFPQSILKCEHNLKALKRKHVFYFFVFFFLNLFLNWHIPEIYSICLQGKFIVCSRNSTTMQKQQK